MSVHEQAPYQPPDIAECVRKASTPYREPRLPDIKSIYDEVELTDDEVTQLEEMHAAKWFRLGALK